MSPLPVTPSPLSVICTDFKTSIDGLDEIVTTVGSSWATVSGSSDVPLTFLACPGLLAVIFATFITLPLSTAG